MMPEPKWLNLAYTLLGQSSETMAPWEGVQKAFRNALPRPDGEKSPFETSFYFASTLLVVVIACYIVARSVQRRKEQPSARPPYQYFTRLLKLLGLNAWDRCLLRRVAKHAHLTEPAVLLLNQGLLSQHARAWSQTVTLSPLRDYLRRRLQRIADAVFEDTRSETA